MLNDSKHRKRFQVQLAIKLPLRSLIRLLPKMEKKQTRLLLLMIFIVFQFNLWNPKSGVANDLVQTAGVKDRTQMPDEFQLPERKPVSVEVPQTYNLKTMLGETGLKVGIGVGVFLIFILLYSRQRSSQTLPREAIEVLGALPMASRQQIQLIRFGQKLVLVESSADGLKPISEITDPTEVNQMLDLIRPRTQ